MTRSELIARLAAAHPALLVRDIERIVHTVFDEISEALARGDRVELRGFGAFIPRRREARTGRNPRTGAAVAIEEKNVPFFKVGKELRERVNQGPPAPAKRPDPKAAAAKSADPKRSPAKSTGAKSTGAKSGAKRS